MIQEEAKTYQAKQVETNGIRVAEKIVPETAVVEQPQPTGNGFTEEEFLREVKETAERLDSPYSEEVTKKVIKTYSHNFHNDVVLWRATNVAKAPLNYRFSVAQPCDTLTPAVEAGLVSADNPGLALVKNWCSIWPMQTLQLCDFDAAKGLTKTWCLWSELKPFGPILDAEGVPEGVRKHRALFEELNLEVIRFTAADYHKGSMNFYFVIPGDLSEERIYSLIGMTGFTGTIPASRMAELKKFISKKELHFAITFKPSGDIERVAFYAIKLPEGQMPELGERLEIFTTQTPSYDKEKMHIVAWSFDKTGECSLKIEQSYRGGLYELLAMWGAAFSATGYLDKDKQRSSPDPEEWEQPF